MSGFSSGCAVTLHNRRRRVYDSIGRSSGADRTAKKDRPAGLPFHDGATI
ncbi:MAG: hypothetical protein L0228_13440 [Planctomycetes bacterium]|nr:hypothetical protein [Planctomycetota bacterium]